MEIIEIFNKPLISVIMPAFNAEKYINQSIDSVLNQTFTNFELIIINDGSSDTTKDIVSSYADKRIKLINISNSGTCAALNIGIKNSKGKYLKFLDADDLLNNSHLEAQLHCLINSCIDSAVVSCKWIRFYDNDLSNFREVPESVWESIPSKEWILRSLRQESDMMPQWLWLIPRQLFYKSGFFNEQLTYNFDFEFSIRLLLNATQVLFSEKSIVYYRTGNVNSLSNIRNENAWISVLTSTNIATSLLINEFNNTEIKKLCAKRYFNILYELYPDFPSIASELNRQIYKLGYSKFQIAGSFKLRLISYLFGWKVVKIIKIIQTKICVFL